jgi:hypothetical protein
MAATLEQPGISQLHERSDVETLAGLLTGSWFFRFQISRFAVKCLRERVIDGRGKW